MVNKDVKSSSDETSQTYKRESYAVAPTPSDTSNDVERGIINLDAVRD